MMSEPQPGDPVNPTIESHITCAGTFDVGCCMPLLWPCGESDVAGMPMFTVERPATRGRGMRKLKYHEKYVVLSHY